MREWWRRQPDEKKRAYLDRRQAVRGEEIREKDRQRYRDGKVPGPRGQKKDRSRWMVHNALRDKRLMKAPCEVCGESKVAAHHENYDEPLEVRWLCRKHHMELHRKYVGDRGAV